MLETFPADVILTDLNMPGLDGFGFLQRLRDAGRHAADDRADGVRQHRDGREDGARTGRVLVPGKADSGGHAGGSDSPCRNARRAARGEAECWNATWSTRARSARWWATSPRMQEIFALLQQAGPSKACVLITGRERHRQGDGGAHAARAESPAAGAVRGDQLRGAAGNADRKRTVRSRKGLVSRAPRNGARAVSNWRSTARCCWTKSARCRCRHRRSCCGFWRIPRCAGWAGGPSSKWTCAWWRRPTRSPRKPCSGGHLREDLFYRLNVFHVHLPPLRERKEDIPTMAEALIGDLNRKHECRVTEISPAVMSCLQRHNWPGNVRELRNVLERAVILAGEGTIEVKHLPAFLQDRPASPCRRGRRRRRWPCRTTGVGAIPDRHHRGRGGEGSDSAHAGAHGEQQDAGRGDPGDQPEDAAQQAEGVRGEGSGNRGVDGRSYAVDRQRYL